MILKSLYVGLFIFSVLGSGICRADAITVEIPENSAGNFVDILFNKVEAKLGVQKGRSVLCYGAKALVDDNKSVLEKLDPNYLVSQFSRNLMHYCPAELANYMVANRATLKTVMRNYYKCRNLESDPHATERTISNKCVYNQSKSDFEAVQIVGASPYVKMDIKLNTIMALGYHIKVNSIGDAEPFCSSIDEWANLNIDVIRQNKANIVQLVNGILVPMIDECTDQTIEMSKRMVRTNPWIITENKDKLSEIADLVLPKLFDKDAKKACDFISSILSENLVKELNKPEFSAMIDKYGMKMFNSCQNEALALADKYCDVAKQFFNRQKAWAINAVVNNPALASSNHSCVESIIKDLKAHPGQGIITGLQAVRAAVNKK